MIAEMFAKCNGNYFKFALAEQPHSYQFKGGPRGPLKFGNVLAK